MADIPIPLPLSQLSQLPPGSGPRREAVNTHLHTQDTGSQFFSQMPSSHLVNVYLTATRPVIKNL